MTEEAEARIGEYPLVEAKFYPRDRPDTRIVLMGELVHQRLAYGHLTNTAVYIR